MQRSNFISLCREVLGERNSQNAKWGEQNHPDGTGHFTLIEEADLARARCERAFNEGVGTWRHILNEEVTEAFAESDTEKLREELVQVAAVTVAWIEAIDRRENGKDASS